MKAVVCRVDRAAVNVDGQCVGAIDRGLLVYLGIMAGDTDADHAWMVRKLVNLRIFPDEQDRMNRSVRDIGGSMLLIPNFTLAARTQKGTRPSFTDAAAPADAGPKFKQIAEDIAGHVPCHTGVFAAHMIIEAVNNGPITICLDSA